jgi:hypothetical protein
MPKELDQPLNFHGDSEVSPSSRSSNHTHTRGIDSRVYAERDPEGDGLGGIMSWGRSTIKLLHHEQFYSPLSVLTADEYLQAKKNGV